MAEYLIFGAIAAVVIIIILWQSLQSAKRELEELKFQIRSKSVKFGQAWENFVPWMKDFKHEPNRCHFLGKPIDIISFDENGVYFIEVKTGKSQMNENEQKVKQNVLDKKVYWEEVRV